MHGTTTHRALNNVPNLEECVLSSAAQLDAPLTSNQATYYPHWIWQHSFVEIDNSLPSAVSSRAVVSFRQTNVHKYWLTA